jgi:hypothetical protein
LSDMLSVAYNVATEEGQEMMVLGIILLVLGFVLGIHLLVVVGIILAVIGAVLALSGGIGHPVGRRWYW